MKSINILVTLIGLSTLSAASPVPNPQSDSTQQGQSYSLPSNVETAQQLDIGGVAPIPEEFAERKEAINEGISSVAGDNPDLRALYHAAAGYETSFGQNFPTEQDQQEVGKLGTPAQEIGLSRMNRNMLQDLGYSENDIQKMNSQTPEGDKLNAEAFARGIQKYGTDGFFHYHRGGITRYENFLNGNLSNDEISDTENFRQHYEAAASQVLVDSLDSPEDHRYAFVSEGVTAI